MQIDTDLLLDVDQLMKLDKYYLYRSEETAGGRPLIDGLYVQKQEIGSTPPVRIRLVLEWTS